MNSFYVLEYRDASGNLIGKEFETYAQAEIYFFDHIESDYGRVDKYETDKTGHTQFIGMIREFGVK